MNDPFGMGRDMMISWEKSMGEMLDRLSHSDQFLQSMSDAFGKSLDFKKQIDGHLQKSLEALNVPTKADMQRMLTYLLRIERKLLDVEDRLASLEDSLGGKAPQAAAPRPAKKKPVTKKALPAKSARRRVDERPSAR